MSSSTDAGATDDAQDTPTGELLQDIEHDEGTDTEFWRKVRRNYED